MKHFQIKHQDHDLKDFGIFYECCFRQALYLRCLGICWWEEPSAQVAIALALEWECSRFFRFGTGCQFLKSLNQNAIHRFVVKNRVWNLPGWWVD